MFARVTIRATDVEASARFYDVVLATLGRERTEADGGAVAWGDFAVAPASDAEPPTRRLHIGFAAPSEHLRMAFPAAGQARAERDPDGNLAEAV
jgi:catechol 2,3-dioxygenase-like lactoylglutathione lyase family enzyme